MFNIISTLIFSRVFGYIIMTFEQFIISFIVKEFKMTQSENAFDSSLSYKQKISND